MERGERRKGGRRGGEERRKGEKRGEEGGRERKYK